MSNKTTPELEHKPIDPKHANKPLDEDCNETDHCDFVNEKEPLNKNNTLKASVTSVNNKHDVEKQADDGHINSETRTTKLKKSNSYKVNNVKRENRNGHALLDSRKIHQLEEELRKRSGLSRYGLLLAILLIVLLFILFTTLIVIVFLWPKNLHSQIYPMCKTPSCLQSSAQMLPMMNTNVSACENFREYACGNWLKNNHIPLQHKHAWDMKTQLSYQQKQKIRDLIVTMPISPTNLDTSSVSWKLKTLFDSCMDVEYIEGEGHKPLTKLLTDIGGWTIQSGKLVLSNPYAWDFTRSLTRVHAGYGGTPYFRVDVVPDPNDALQMIIRVLPAGLGLSDRKLYFLENQHESPILQAYKKYISDMAQYLGVASVAAESLSNDIFHYEKRLAEITPTLDELRNVSSGFKKIPLRDAIIAPKVYLMDILHAKFPDAKLNESTQILVPECEYLDKVSNLISTTDRSARSNYIMWNLATQYFPYISSSFRQTEYVFRNAMYGEVQPLPRWEFCIDIIQHYMGLGVTALIQKNNPLQPHVHQAVEEVFSNVKDTIVEEYRQVGWLSQELRNFISQKIERISIQIGLPSPFIQDKYVNEHYRDLDVYRGGEFFNAIIRGDVFLQREMQQKLISSTDEARWLSALVSPEVSISYIVSANTIVVPSSILNQPFYDPDYTLPLIYGRLGVDMSHAVLSSVSPWQVLYSAEGSLLDTEYPAVNESVAVVVDSAPCVARSIARAVATTELSNEHTTLDTITHISAVRQTFKTLESLLATSPHIHQPALETVEPPSLYFLAYSQGLCRVTSPQYNQLFSLLGHLSDSSLLKTILSQSKQFSNVFSCSSSDELYTEDGCPGII